MIGDRENFIERFYFVVLEKELMCVFSRVRRLIQNMYEESLNYKKLSWFFL